jgi:hypothetical protein
LALIFLWANTLVPKPGNAAATAPSTWAPSTSPSASATAARTAAVHALYAGRTSGDQVTVAIAINGTKAAGDLNAGLASEVPLQGSVNGSRISLTASDGIGLDGSLSGPNMFGTIIGFLGQSFPFSAAQTGVEAVYAGTSSGNQVTLAVVTDGDQATGYVCNGRTIEAWLQGSVHGNQVNLAGLHGASLVGSLSGLAMFGTVTPSAGLSFPFSAALSPKPAGIYQARIIVNGLATRIGWAVLPSGGQLGVAVAGTTRSAAPPLFLGGGDGSFTLDGTSFQASPVAGNQKVVIP